LAFLFAADASPLAGAPALFAVLSPMNRRPQLTFRENSPYKPRTSGQALLPEMAEPCPIT
jgi:hypothetical protein